jgi:serine/threonine protein kinase
MAPTDPTARPCPFCGVAVVGPHQGCAGLFKEIMSAPPESALDEMPPEVQAIQADDTRRLNEYLLVEQIGKGGMGTVWKAWDRKLTRWVAVKFLNGQDADDFARFTREAKLAARLRHPNIAAVFDTGEVPSKQAGQDSVRYLAMEFIEGQSVATADLPLLKWLETFARISRAVDHAHRAGVIHRDIKPTNLMLTKEDWPYVMDFGLAKSLKAGSSVSMSGVILGTPSFMPPEQAGGKTREIDAKSDIYSLGASLYYVLTRQAPFNGEDSVDVIVKVLKTNPPRPRELRPDLPEPVEAVILKAMAREKDQRYATAGEMADDLEKLAAGGTPALQRRSKAPAVAVILLSLAVLLLLGWVLRTPTPPAPTGVPLQMPSPLPAFLDRLRNLKSDRKWIDAAKHVQQASFLRDEQKAPYLHDIEEGCRDDLQKTTAAFCSGILTERLESAEPGFKFVSLESLLPARDQLLLPHPAYEWTSDLLSRLDASRPEELLTAAGAAAAFDDVGDNPWFRAAELAAYRTVLRDLRSQTAKARGETRARVQECRSAADKVAAAWDTMVAGLTPHFRKRHSVLLDNHDAAIRTARNDFPGDPEYLKTLDLAVELNAPDLEHRLEEAERKLRALHAVGNLTRESQHSLLVNLVTARALAGSFQGESADQIAAALKEFAKPLKESGVGGEERSRFGPKVAAVFDRLLLQ